MGRGMSRMFKMKRSNLVVSRGLTYRASNPGHILGTQRLSIPGGHINEQ